MANKIWELAILPKGHKTVGCKWIFHTMRMQRAKLFSTRRGWWPRGILKWPKWISTRLCFHGEIHHDWVHSSNWGGHGFGDLSNGCQCKFLNGMLEVKIYMDQPEGLVQKGKDYHVCKLKKTLYRLKQSPRAWYHWINSFFFVKEGFCRSQTNHSLDIKETGKYLLVAILYVDDLIISVSNVTQLKWLKLELEKEFEMNNLWELHCWWGVGFERNREAHTITMSQKNCIEEVLKWFNVKDCKPFRTPFDAILSC